jgi:hypothetical protein
MPKQMLGRPEVPSWQQYNFAGSMTMAFASGVGPGAVRRRLDAACTEAFGCIREPVGRSKRKLFA